MEIHNQRGQRGAEFEYILGDLVRRAGWRSVLQPKQGSPDMRPDIIVDAKDRKFVIELKSSAEGRSDRLIPLMSQAILMAQMHARQFSNSAVPVAVVAAPYISDSIARQVKQFAMHHAPQVGIGILDAEGLRDFAGYGLEALSKERSAPPHAKSLAQNRSPLDIFSDLNAWMLKILLSANIPESLLSAPRQQYQNASQLAQAAGVSVMSAYRLIGQLSRESFLDEQKGSLRLVRIEELLQRWVAANQGSVREIPARWIIQGGKEQLAVAVHAYVSQIDPRSKGGQEHAESYHPRPAPHVCIGLFAAADLLGFGFVQGIAPHIYLQRLDRGALKQLGLSVDDAERNPDVYIRIPENQAAVFRASVRREGLPVSDILQVWLDVSNHPVRGKEQAEQIWRRVLAPSLQKGGQ